VWKTGEARSREAGVRGGEGFCPKLARAQPKTTDGWVLRVVYWKHALYTGQHYIIILACRKGSALQYTMQESNMLPRNPITGGRLAARALAATHPGVLTPSFGISSTILWAHGDQWAFQRIHAGSRTHIHVPNLPCIDLRKQNTMHTTDTPPAPPNAEHGKEEAMVSQNETENEKQADAARLVQIQQSSAISFQVF